MTNKNKSIIIYSGVTHALPSNLKYVKKNKQKIRTINKHYSKSIFNINNNNFNITSNTNSHIKRHIITVLI